MRQSRRLKWVANEYHVGVEFWIDLRKAHGGLLRYR